MKRWSESEEDYKKDREIINIIEKNLKDNHMKNQIIKTRLILIAVIALIFLIIQAILVAEAFATEIEPPYVVFNPTQIEQNGHSFQIEGVKPVESKTGEGMIWLLDTAELKAQSKPKGMELKVVECKEVLLNRHLCKDIQFSDGSSVKTAVLQRGYATKK